MKRKKNRILTVFIIVIAIISSTAAFLSNLDNIISFYKKYFTVEIPTPDKIANYRKRAEWLNDYGGDRRSYEILLSWEEKIKNPEISGILLTEMERLKSVYGADIMTIVIENNRSICKFITEPGVSPRAEGFEPPIGYNARNVFQHLDRPIWTERARAACLLRNIEKSPNKDEVDKKEVCEKLVNLMKKEKENSLFVSKMAFETYKNLTGFYSLGVFDFGKAIKDWEQRKNK